MLAHDAVVESIPAGGGACVKGEIAVALDTVARDRETRFVDGAANGDDASVDDGAGVQKRIATDDDDVAVHATLDQDVAMHDNDALRVCGVARQDGWYFRWRDQSMGRCQDFGEAATEGSGSRVAHDDLLR